MADKPKTTHRGRMFKGLMTNASPHTIPIDASTQQNNVRCQEIGQLDVRPGIRPVTFANATTASTAEVQSGYFYHGPIADFVVYQLSDGIIKAGRGPAL